MTGVIERIQRELQIPDLVQRLGDLSPTDLQSLLLAVYQAQSKRKQPAGVLKDYVQNRFVRPTRLSLKRSLELERMFMDCLAPEVEMLELSPVCPLGSSSVIAGIDQNWAVSTSRNTEVVSDATNVLALECALRRKTSSRRQIVHLAASHRFLRAQFYDNPALLPHFRMFSMCSAGHDQGNLSFELSCLYRQIRFYMQVMEAFLGDDILKEVTITDFTMHDKQRITTGLIETLQAEFPRAGFTFDDARQAGKGYYRDLCFHIYAQSKTGDWVELADGGSVDWTAKLLSNAKERLVISGISSERLCTAFV